MNNDNHVELAVNRIGEITERWARYVERSQPTDEWDEGYDGGMENCIGEIQITLARIQQADDEEWSEERRQALEDAFVAGYTAARNRGRWYSPMKKISVQTAKGLFVKYHSPSTADPRDDR